MRTKENNESLISPHLSLSSFEMGRDDVNVVCTYGKISIWFGRQVPDVVIGQIFLGIAKIDQAAVHELDIICDFDEITEFESNGYVLVSYARSKEGYRTTFHVPFSSKKALFNLAGSVTRELKNENTVVDCYWTGDDSDIMRLYEELSNIEDWKIKNIHYKEDLKDKSNE
ncbi:hypothetical protein HWN40_00625 [Methanolobus zinderi]|jgi:hypothetical protein|uniref:Uncharacterized protein n=1 Tax=Methanolobus zinderi TaxID=536044 RepID=A0A7D5I789_9EURY|nr:hypothetical protein [Methanolobus zinderi]KXS44046.1 MAG: hypothetical protein AWU59_772 [Methanolobus sp. T82-4]QLC48882.1 hypothetical protein HWN40_00625 [Methanolobus zinderi]